jgi:hypothetical protein
MGNLSGAGEVSEMAFLLLRLKMNNVLRRGLISDPGREKA